MSRHRLSLLFALLAMTVALVSVPAPAWADSFTVTATATPAGLTEFSIGANESCARFDVTDLVDFGPGNYRLYAGMSRLEP